MNNDENYFKDIILGFIILISLVVGIYFLMKYLINNVKMDIPVPVIVAVFSIISAIVGGYITKRLEKEKEIELKLREKKVPMYKKIVDFHLDLLNEGKVNDNETEKFIRDITKKLLIWGSDDVINKWEEYRTNLVQNALKSEKIEKKENEENEENIEGVFLFEELLLVIREDMGHKNKKINKKGKLLSLFINDIDNYI